MPTGQTVISVSHGQYWIAEMGVDQDITDDMYQGSNGLISTQGFFAIMMTGTEFGKVSLTVDWRDDEPPLDLKSWDEVVDVSLHFEEDQGVVYGPHAADTADLPRLDAGSYRVRVHARGRDRGNALTTVHGAPVEEHLVVAWPASPSAEVRHKLTDAYGESVRAW